MTEYKVSDLVVALGLNSFESRQPISHPSVIAHVIAKADAYAPLLADFTSQLLPVFARYYLLKLDDSRFQVSSALVLAHLSDGPLFGRWVRNDLTGLAATVALVLCCRMRRRSLDEGGDVSQTSVLTPFQLGTHAKITLRILLSFQDPSLVIQTFMSTTSAYELSIRLASFAQTIVADVNASDASKTTTADFAGQLSRLLAHGDVEAIRFKLSGEKGVADWFACAGAGNGSPCVEWAEKWVACAKCGAVRYCSREHQTSHWATHLKTCRFPTWSTSATI